MAPQAWVDARLGRFEYDDDCECWRARVAAPSFNAFTYVWLVGEEDPRGLYELTICNDEAGQTNRPAAVAMILDVLEKQQHLVRAVMQAMWDDINDRGPDSGMWWHGDLNFPAGDTTGRKRSMIGDILAQDGVSLNRREDLLKVMGLREIAARGNVRGHNGVLIELRFTAAFELEHGVGILTDGSRILGTGYELDVDLFEQT